MNQYFLVVTLNEVKHCIHVWGQTHEMWLYVQVRSLEAKNRQLEQNIAEFCQQRSTVVTKNYGGYFSTINDLRAEVPPTLYITQHTETMIKMKQTILHCTRNLEHIQCKRRPKKTAYQTPELNIYALVWDIFPLFYYHNKYWHQLMLKCGFEGLEPVVPNVTDRWHPKKAELLRKAK